MTQLTMGSYNLRNGGLGPGGDDGRLRRQLRLLDQLGADVWALQECRWWDRDYFRVLHQAERLLGMRGFLVESNHHGCHVALFIRESAVRVIEQRHDRQPPWWHALARVVAEVGAAGDWNAAPAAGTCFPPAGVSPAQARRKLDRRAARAIEEAGFTDVGAWAGNLTPTVGYGKPGLLAYRCDRIYTTLPPRAIAGLRSSTKPSLNQITVRSWPSSTSPPPR